MTQRKLTHESIEAFCVASDAVSMAKTVFLATAHAQLMREKVDAISIRVLSESPLYVCKEFMDMGLKVDHRILNPKHAYLAEKEDWEKFHANVVAVQNKEGLLPDKPGNCPALEAETLQCQAENLLINHGMGHFGMGGSELGMSLELRSKLLDSFLGMLAPRCHANQMITSILV